MNSDPFGAIPGTEILQALENIGALDDIRPQLAKNYEGVMRQLETIPSDIIYGLLDVTYTPPENFVNYANRVGGIVDKIIGQSDKQRRPLIKRLEFKLHKAIKQDMISPESLCLCSNYLQVFCKKYPPRKTKDSVTPEDDDIMYEDPYAILDGEDAIMLGNDTRKIGSEEIKTLFLIIEIITHYTHILTTLTLHPSLEIKIRERYMESIQEKLTYIKKIQIELIKILSWGKSRTPYMSLCTGGGPLSRDKIQEIIRDLNHILEQSSTKK